MWSQTGLYVMCTCMLMYTWEWKVLKSEDIRTYVVRFYTEKPTKTIQNVPFGSQVV